MRARPLAAALAACSVTAATTAVPLAAQDATYHWSVGDTLRYRNATKMEGVVHGAAGDAPFTLSRNATYAFAFGGGEALTAWYEALTVEASGALGGDKPNPQELLHLPYHLRMEPNGRVVTIKSPTLPRTARLIAELSPQLDDFFPRLPLSGKVAAGTTWTDTVTRSENDPDGHKVSVRRISHYTAGGDSTFEGKRGIVITQHTEVRITTSSPMQQQPFVATLSLTGNEDGTALFSIADGRMLARERNGELRGEVTYKGGDKPWVVNQSYRFHRTDVLEAPPPRP
ncbi:MAG TPA: hypothetical protein VN613_04620 [Gemmatimonadaceae bacterium]|nr:hypothetical protein [Gemmatimonadaceae bacterium]